MAYLMTHSFCLVQWCKFSFQMEFMPTTISTPHTCPFFDRLPFNWKTPFGYFCAFFLACLVTYTMLFTILPLICTSMGSCLLMTTLLKDTLNRFHGINSGLAQKNAAEIKDAFYDIIADFLDLKQLSLQPLSHSKQMLNNNLIYFDLG